ncbi:unnamed protein product, partial [marine sediment metagenome]
MKKFLKKLLKALMWTGIIFGGAIVVGVIMCWDDVFPTKSNKVTVRTSQETFLYATQGELWKINDKNIALMD